MYMKSMNSKAPTLSFAKQKTNKISWLMQEFIFENVLWLLLKRELIPNVIKQKKKIWTS